MVPCSRYPAGKRSVAASMTTTCSVGADVATAMLLSLTVALQSMCMGGEGGWGRGGAGGGSSGSKLSESA